MILIESFKELLIDTDDDDEKKKIINPERILISKAHLSFTRHQCNNPYF